MKLIAALMLFCVSLPGMACSVPPKTLFQSDRELVERSQHIALAKVTHIAPGQENNLRTVEFETLEMLKGKVPGSFSLKGYDANEVKGAPKDFGGHRMPAFWAYSVGNTILPGDCQAYGLFETDGTFLVFYDGPSHYRSFEQIKVQDDLWLNVVRLLIQRSDVNVAK